MKNHFFIFLLVAASLAGMAQEIKLTGRVSIHNSRYNTGAIQYVPNAYVSAAFSKADDTDEKGYFELQFVGIEPGTIVDIGIEKSGLEVVNQYDLQRVVIGRKLAVPVFLAPKGELASAQTELYKISKEALFARKDSLIASLNAETEESKKTIAELEKTFRAEINNRFEAEDLLNYKIEELQKKLPEYARTLARQNLDFASDLYLEAYAFFRKGEIEKVIQVLNENDLGNSVQEALKNIEKARELEHKAKEIRENSFLQFNQNLNSYELKAESYLLLFDYSNAIKQYEKIIGYYEQFPFDKLKLAQSYFKLSTACYFAGKYAEDKKYKLKSIRIQEEILEPNDSRLATVYSQLAYTLRVLGEYDEAMTYQYKALEIQEKILDPNDPELAFSLSSYALIQQSLGHYEQAKDYQEKAIAIWESIVDSTNKVLGYAYNDIAFIYADLGDYDQAMNYQFKAVKVVEEALDPLHPEVAASYNNLGTFYQDLEEYDKSIAAFEKAITIQKKSLDNNHPRLATTYNNLALSYNKTGRYAEAIELFEKSIEIKRNTFGNWHIGVAIAYNNLATVYRSTEAWETAILYHKKSIEIREKVLAVDHPKLWLGYFDMGNTCYHAKKYDEAVLFYEKANEVSAVPFRDYFYNNIGLAYAKNGQLDLAKKAFKEDEKLFPDYGGVYRNWSLYFGLKGDKKKTTENLQKAVELGYSNLSWIKTDESLDIIRNEQAYLVIINLLENKTN